MTDTDKLRYPVGPLPRIASPLDDATRRRYIDALDAAPANFRRLTNGLSDAQLETPYRPGGWTIRQVVHHVPDSHVNAYVRMKLAVTEDAPAIKTYEEQLWAELPDGKSGPIDMSLALLDALHRRWVAFLRQLPADRFRRGYAHAQWGLVTVDESLAMYEWHCRHHAGHIEAALRAASGAGC